MKFRKGLSIALSLAVPAPPWHPRCPQLLSTYRRDEDNKDRYIPYSSDGASLHKPVSHIRDVHSAQGEFRLGDGRSQTSLLSRHDRDTASGSSRPDAHS